MALASPWGSPPDWRPWRMILPPTVADPIAGSGLTLYFRKRKKVAGPVCPENRFGRGMRPEHFAAVRL